MRPPEPPVASAGLARRLAATLYESLILAALTLVLGFLLLPFLGQAEMPAATSRLALLPPAAKAASFAALLALYGGYYVWFSSGGRRTLPMQTWGLALQAAEGGAPSPARALCRYAAWWIGPGCAAALYLALRPFGEGRWALTALALNYAWVLGDRDRRFLHDRVAGTRLVRV